MTREHIEKAAKEAVQNHFQCNGKYPCEERDYCEFCNGQNSAFDCREDCGADDFNEGFISGAQWRINSVWHDASEMPEKGRPLLEFCRGTRCGEYYEIGGRISIKNQEWDDFYKFAGIVYWAYIDELIPERKDE